MAVGEVAWATKGKYYIARPNLVYGPSVPDAVETDQLTCVVCNLQYERPDIADCPFVAGSICSLCCSLEATCHDECKTGTPVPLGIPALRHAG